MERITQLPKEAQSKLTEKQTQPFIDAFNAAVDSGETESVCLRRGWQAAVSVDSRIVHHMFLFRPGDWDAAQGDGKITEHMVDDAVFAINRCEELGVPIALKYMHSEEDASISVGIVKNVTIEDGHAAYGDGYVLQDARADRDGQGMKTLADINQMADALLTEGMNLSVEAFYDVKVPSYYGDRVISLEPSAMAILPAGVAPAVTEKMIAERSRGRPVAFLANKETLEGGAQMELEELVKLVEGLVTKVEALEQGLMEKKPDEGEKSPDMAELEKANTDLQAKLDAVEEKTLTAEVETLEAEVKEKMLPGQVEKLDAELEKITDLSEKKVALSRINSVTEFPAGRTSKLKAGRRSSGTNEDKLYAERDRQVDERMNNLGESKYTALRKVNKTFDFNRKE
jgi:hypothetical protein